MHVLEWCFHVIRSVVDQIWTLSFVLSQTYVSVMWRSTEKMMWLSVLCHISHRTEIQPETCLLCCHMCACCTLNSRSLENNLFTFSESTLCIIKSRPKTRSAVVLYGSWFIIIITSREIPDPASSLSPPTTTPLIRWGAFDSRSTGWASDVVRVAQRVAMMSI